jgi:hypothetical protein
VDDDKCSHGEPLDGQCEKCWNSEENRAIQAWKRGEPESVEKMRRVFVGTTDNPDEQANP